MYDTMQDSGYVVLGYAPKESAYILIEKTSGKIELWGCVKNHASYGIKYNNTHLEFCSSPSKVYKVVNNEFNRAWYPSMINRLYLTPPFYANVITIESYQARIVK